VAVRTLVTGAFGFIGSHLVERLLQDGYEVRAFVDYLSQNQAHTDRKRVEEALLPHIEIFSGDIRDQETVRNAVRNCDLIFHLASLTGVPYSYQAPGSYLQNNVRGTLNILESVRELECKKLVYVSSSEVYGPARTIPVTEDHPLCPQSPYAATKCSADQLALSYHASFQTPVVVLRPFNTYGPRQTARAVIPATIKQLVCGTSTLKLGALDSTRDFTYVSDMVDAFVRAALSQKASGEAINVGSNFETSIADAVSTIIEIMDAKVTVECDQARLRPGAKADRVRCDNSKAKSLLDWQPEYAGKEGFAAGLRHTIDSFLKHHTLAAESAAGYHV
jgi:NAD dependent epimerase/dehydratase